MHQFIDNGRWLHQASATCEYREYDKYLLRLFHESTTRPAFPG
jgi:hypothetical protein